MQGFCTIGGNALIIFLDIMSLEMGKDFQVAFVDALTRSSAAVLIASHDALERMLTHDPAVPDNVLIEWLTALYLERKKRLYVMPIFVGQHAEVTGDSDSLGGKFFELFPVETVSVFKSMSKYTARSFAAAAAIASKSSSGSGNKCTMVQMLPDDITADATVRKAVELLKSAGKWEDGDEIDPPSSFFGLASFSVRAIVTKITACNGQFASDRSSVSDLLFKTSDDIKKILAGKELGTSSVEGCSPLLPPPPLHPPLTPSWPNAATAFPNTAAAVNPSSSDAVVSGGLDRAWAVLHTDAFVKPGRMLELHQFLVEEEFDSADDLATLLSDRYTHLLEKMTTFLTKKGEREFTVAMDRT